MATHLSSPRQRLNLNPKLNSNFTRNSTLTLIVLAALSVLSFPRNSATAAGYSAETISTAAPAQVPAAILDTLSDKGIRVNGPSGPFCEIWLRKVVPVKDAPQQQLGVEYGQIAEGTLVGVIRFLSDVKDYRQQAVKAGVYTLRFALLPQNGNHLGVSPNRDFLLASPVSADQKPDTLSVEEVLALSRKAAGAGHPSVWNLASLGELSFTPSIKHQEDPDLWMVGFGLNLQSAPNKLNIRAAWLVVVGHAPEA